MEALVSLETMIEPRDLVYCLGLEPALLGRKAEVSPPRPPLSLRILEPREDYVYIYLSLLQVDCYRPDRLSTHVLLIPLVSMVD